MDCLRSDDVERDVAIEAAFSVGPCFASCYATNAKYPPPPQTDVKIETVFSTWSVPSLYGKPWRLFKVIRRSVVGWRSEQQQQTVRVEKSTCEDLACDLKTPSVL
jgi:hypothetical protein